MNISILIGIIGTQEIILLLLFVFGIVFLIKILTKKKAPAHLITQNSQEFQNIIQQSAVLRGQRKYKDALMLLERNLPRMANDCLFNAYMEAIYAAEESGDIATAQRYARLLQPLDPNLPTVKRILGQ